MREPPSRHTNYWRARKTPRARLHRVGPDKPISSLALRAVDNLQSHHWTTVPKDVADSCRRLKAGCGERRLCTTATESSAQTFADVENIHPTWSDVNALQARVEKLLAPPAAKMASGSYASRTKTFPSPVPPVPLHTYQAASHGCKAPQALGGRKPKSLGMRTEWKETGKPWHSHSVWRRRRLNWRQPEKRCEEVKGVTPI